MRKLGLALALTIMGATAASAQGIEFRLGNPDRSWDAPRERVIVRDRRRYRDVDTTGSVGCRTTIVKRRNAYGEMVTRRIRECED